MTIDTLIAYSLRHGSASDDSGGNTILLRKATGLLSDDEREQLVGFVGSNPEVGDVIPESGGIRKLRWAGKGKGKSGGVRVIYYFHGEAFPVFLLTVYAKSQKANLTKAERNELKALAPLLVKKYGKGRRQ